MTLSSRDGGGHPDLAEISALLDGEPSAKPTAEVEDHLASCESCGQLRAALATAHGRLGEYFSSGLVTREAGAPERESAVAAAMAAPEDGQAVSHAGRRRGRVAVAALVLSGAAVAGGLAAADHLAPTRHSAAPVLGAAARHPTAHKSASTSSTRAGSQFGTSAGGVAFARANGPAHCSEAGTASGRRVVLARVEGGCVRVTATSLVLQRGALVSHTVVRTSGGRWKVTVTLASPVPSGVGRGPLVAVVDRSVVGSVRRLAARRFVIVGRGSPALRRLTRVL